MGPIRNPRWEQKRTEGYVIVSIYLADETYVHVLVKEDNDINVTGVHRFRWNVFISISMQNWFFLQFITLVARLNTNKLLFLFVFW
jgi:hypothetical protein